MGWEGGSGREDERAGVDVSSGSWSSMPPRVARDVEQRRASTDSVSAGSPTPTKECAHTQRSPQRNRSAIEPRTKVQPGSGDVGIGCSSDRIASMIISDTRHVSKRDSNSSTSQAWKTGSTTSEKWRCSVVQTCGRGGGMWPGYLTRGWCGRATSMRIIEVM